MMPVSNFSAALTPAEQAIMALVCDGMTNKEIASHLGKSYRTVECQRQSVLKKMRVKTMARAAVIYTLERLV